MPWLPQANTLLHAWYGGQECGNSIIDVLFGTVNPSGRLSVTFPRVLEDTPAFLSFGKADNTLVYGEGVFVSHRYYEKVKRDPMFYFGYGLSYTTFEYSNLAVPSIFESNREHVLKFSVDIHNTGERNGDEVVQAYVADIEATVQRPIKELKTFAKVSLRAGEKRTVQLELDRYAVSFWSEHFKEWRAEAGDFKIILARSADPKDTLLMAAFTLPQTFMWSGV